MKRTLALIFMTLANIVLLAHLMVPHHHHHDGAVVCLELADARQHCSDFDPDAALDADDHHHHHHKSNGRCTLEDLFSRIDIISKKTTWSISFVYSPHAFSLYFQPDTNQLISQLSVFEGERVLHKPFLMSYHSFVARRACPLRAPPVC